VMSGVVPVAGGELLFSSFGRQDGPDVSGALAGWGPRRAEGGAAVGDTQHAAVAVALSIVAQPAQAAGGLLHQGRVDDLQRVLHDRIGGRQLAEPDQFQEPGVDDRALGQRRAAVTGVASVIPCPNFKNISRDYAFNGVDSRACLELKNSRHRGDNATSPGNSWIRGRCTGNANSSSSSTDPLQRHLIAFNRQTQWHRSVLPTARSQGRRSEPSHRLNISGRRADQVPRAIMVFGVTVASSPIQVPLLFPSLVFN
jgi:hypothetical protein